MRKEDASPIVAAGVAVRRVIALATVLTALTAPWVAADELRVGIIKYKTVDRVEATYTPLVEYLAGKLGEEPVVTVVEDGSLAFRLSEDEFDLGVFTQFPYLEAKLHFPQLDVFASHEVDGSPSYRGVILVRADSGHRSLSDLRGGRFLFVKPTSTSGFKYPVGIFREHGFQVDVPEGLTLDSDVEGSFFNYSFSGGHAESLASLLRGEAAGVAIDAAALDELTAEERGELEAIEEYQLPYHAYVFGPGVGDARRAEIRRLMLAAHHDPAAVGGFDNPLGVERWVARRDTDYNALRRYLGMVRMRPTITVDAKARESARRALVEESDTLEEIQTGIEWALEGTGRFDPVPSGGTHALSLDIGRVDDGYVARLSLDGERAATFSLERADLVRGLPHLVSSQTLEHFPLDARLLSADSRWFITYGTNDGLSPEGYRFVLEPASGAPIELGDDAILEMNGVNTFFAPRPEFERGGDIVARFRMDEALATRAVVPAESSLGLAPSSRPGEAGEEGFFDNLDNRWGVIGLLVALATVGLGSWLSQRKKRRFTSIRNETLQLLSIYVESKYDVAVKIAEQREKIQRHLDDGYITENQYLILKDHINEVERVIGKLGSEEASAGAEGLSEEVREAVADGIVTEKELHTLAEHAGAAPEGPTPESPQPGPSDDSKGPPN